MKYILIALVAVAGVALFSACDKTNLLDENNKQAPVDPAKTTGIRFIHCFAGNTPQLPTAASATTGPQVFLYANGKKLTGGAVSYTGTFPVTNVYDVLAPGSTRLDIVMARMNLAVVPNVPAQAAGDTLLTVTQSFEAGKNYSLYFGDTVGSFKLTVKEDLLPTPDYQTYKIRMAHLVMNPSDTFNLYSRREQATIIPDITHKQVSDWVQLNVPIINDTLEIRRKGTTTAFLTVNAFAPTGLRFYTVLLRGKNGLTGKTPSAGIITNK